ncbi:MAG: M15 family metallopeptidase [Clostridia bacterium]|nr:M15 family metallopeptidase [Clostridia bacterium]
MKKLMIILVTLATVSVLIFGTIQSLQQDFLSLQGSVIWEISKKEATTENGWELILVNREYRVPESYEIELLTLSNGQQIDKRIYPPLQEMFDDMRAKGIYPTVVSGYRSYDEQRDLLEEKYLAYRSEGYSKARAKELATEWVALPGTSEHQLGIAVDINPDYSVSDGEGVYDWLRDNAHKYGFIKRYPEDKTEITGIINEPWHYRYVGKKAATYMYENNLCLEEYVEQL